MGVLTPTQVLWAASNNPVLAGMAATTRLTDGSFGDTGTYESSSASHIAGAPTYTATAYLTVVSDFGATYTVDTASLTYRFTGNGTGGGGPAGAQTDTSVSASIAVAYSTDGSSWTSLGALLGSPSFTWNGAIWYAGFTSSTGFPAINARYLRYTLEVTTTANTSLPIASSAIASDVWFTGTVVGGGSPPPGPGGWTGGDPPPATVYVGDADICAGWQEVGGC